MKQIASIEALARTFTVHVDDVRRWVDDGCPHFHLRAELVLLDYQEVSRWLLQQPADDHHPLTFFAARVVTARTWEDVARLNLDLEALIANGDVDSARLPAVRRGLFALARKLRERGEGA